jgi:predicted nucleotidyltransferase
LFYLSLEEKYGADGRTANRLYNEKKQERDAAIMAARLKAEEQARIDAELKARAISDMERSLKDAEAAVFAIANGFHECRELVLRQQARKEIVINNLCEVQLRAFDLFEAKNPALKPQLD